MDHVDVDFWLGTSANPNYRNMILSKALPLGNEGKDRPVVRS